MNATVDKPTIVTADRCDHRNCGAAAQVITMHGDMPLYHCGHCFRPLESRLLADVIVDQRSTLR